MAREEKEHLRKAGRPLPRRVKTFIRQILRNGHPTSNLGGLQRPPLVKEAIESSADYHHPSQGLGSGNESMQCIASPSCPADQGDPTSNLGGPQRSLLVREAIQ
ncbi:hypothetical protein QAD02_002530 [Eretmocerus hayati]|uniref:Uncharacterized protein n=1 Tax=Eretmocerus hayati TaxID=131215 RepID=A0ACC2NJJ6_9HYME|nr:hypothetical protein QAD02_002530 [Eretmocerus hayati]